MASPMRGGHSSKIFRFSIMLNFRIFFNLVFINVIPERLCKRTVYIHFLLNSCNLRAQGRKTVNLVLYLASVPHSVAHHEAGQQRKHPGRWSAINADGPKGKR